MVKRKSYYL